MAEVYDTMYKHLHRACQNMPKQRGFHHHQGSGYWAPVVDEELREYVFEVVERTRGRYPIRRANVELLTFLPSEVK